MNLQVLLLVSVILIFAGILLLMAYSLLLVNKSNAEIAVGGFIGFIPFGFFTSKKMFFVWLAFTLAFLVFLILFILFRKIV